MRAITVFKSGLIVALIETVAKALYIFISNNTQIHGERAFNLSVAILALFGLIVFMRYCLHFGIVYLIYLSMAASFFEVLFHQVIGFLFFPGIVKDMELFSVIHLKKLLLAFGGMTVIHFVYFIFARIIGRRFKETINAVSI